MDFKAKIASGALGGGVISALIGPLSESLDKWAEVHSPFFMTWSVETWEVVVGTLLGVALGGPALVIAEILRQLLFKALAAAGIDTTKIARIIGNGVAVGMLLTIVGCATPTDKYYTSLSALAGVRASMISYCELPSAGRNECEMFRDKFFIPGDQAVEAMENARQAVLSACSEGQTPECEGAGKKLVAAAGAVTSLANDAAKVLRERGVKQ